MSVLSAEYGRTNWSPPFFLGLIAVMLGTVILCPPRGWTVDGEVVRVIDGDTIVVRTSIEYHVRLLDCWAPESRTTNPDEKARGLRAKKRMEQLAATGHSVRVHVPNASSDLTEAITMGRLLGRVWLTKNGQPAAEDLSVTMVREGLATVEKVKVPK